MPDERDIVGDGKNGLATRVAVLEAKVRLISLALKGFIAAIFAAVVAWLFGRP